MEQPPVNVAVAEDTTVGLVVCTAAVDAMRAAELGCCAKVRVTGRAIVAGPAGAAKDSWVWSKSVGGLASQSAWSVPETDQLMVSPGPESMVNVAWPEHT